MPKEESKYAAIWSGGYRERPIAGVGGSSITNFAALLNCLLYHSAGRAAAAAGIGSPDMMRWRKPGASHQLRVHGDRLIAAEGSTGCSRSF
jgi:hypothetical protein